MAPDRSGWDEIFVNRTDELEYFRQCWGDVQAGNGPRLVPLLAESGIGKTRLIQEFYSLLADEHDPDDYWPDPSEWTGSVDGWINPRFQESNLDHSSTEKTIPWLWLGLTFTDPEHRRTISEQSSVMDRLLRDIQPHLAPIILSRSKKELRKNYLKKGASILLDEVVPGLSAVQELYETINEWQDFTAENRALQEKAISRIQEEEKIKIREKLFEALRDILSTDQAQGDNFPLVVVVDDAQWIQPQSLQLFEGLLEASYENEWPVLFVVSHWEKEWKEYVNDANSDRVPGVIQRHQNRLGDDATPVRLEKLNDSDDMRILVQEALPGLTQEQMKVLLERSGGNPLYLKEIIRSFLQKKRKIFENGDPSRPLNEKGERYVQDVRNIDLYKLTQDRFYELEPGLQQLLEWASHCEIDLSFLHDLLFDVAQSFDSEIDKEQFQEYLDRAQSPASFIRKRTSESLFEQKLFRDVAADSLAEFEEDERKLYRSLLDVLEDWRNEDRFYEYGFGEVEKLYQLFDDALERLREFDGLSPEEIDLHIDVKNERLDELYVVGADDVGPELCEEYLDYVEEHRSRESEAYVRGLINYSAFRFKDNLSTAVEYLRDATRTMVEHDLLEDQQPFYKAQVNLFQILFGNHDELYDLSSAFDDQGTVIIPTDLPDSFDEELYEFILHLSELQRGTAATGKDSGQEFSIDEHLRPARECLSQMAGPLALQVGPTLARFHLDRNELDPARKTLELAFEGTYLEEEFESIPGMVKEFYSLFSNFEEDPADFFDSLPNPVLMGLTTLILCNFVLSVKEKQARVADHSVPILDYLIGERGLTSLHGTYLFWNGRRHFNVDRYEEARDVFHRALDHYRGNEPFHVRGIRAINQIGLCEFNLGEYDVSIEHYETALSKLLGDNPESLSPDEVTLASTILHNKALANKKLENLQLARQSYERAIDLLEEYRPDSDKIDQYREKINNLHREDGEESGEDTTDDERREEILDNVKERLNDLEVADDPESSEQS